MKNNPKNVNVPVIVILYLLAAIFLGYGIYMAYDAIIYVNTYDTNTAVSSSNMLQYVVAASASYFGFAIIIFAAASILGALNKVQRNISGLLAFDDRMDEFPEDVLESAPVEEIIENTPADEIVEEITENAPVEDDAAPEDVIDAPAEKDETAVSEETAPADELEAPVGELETPVGELETPVDELEELPEAENEAASATEEAPEEPLINLIQAAAAQSATPEIIAQQQPTPEIVINRQPAMKESPQRQTTSEVPAENTATNLKPPTIPEEILQTKRKRGLKYETVAMEESKSTADYPQNLSDTIRLKKEDRDAISSAFIRDIFEKHE